VRIGGQKARRDEQVKRFQKWRHVRRSQLRVQVMLLREALTTSDVVREALTTSDIVREMLTTSDFVREPLTKSEACHRAAHNK
jgi:hypothetical protein